MVRIKCLLATFSLVAFSVLSTQATTIHVPADQPTIQAGIDAAIPGDTVLVADGTYAGDDNRDFDFSGKNIVLKSENSMSGNDVGEFESTEMVDENRDGQLSVPNARRGELLEGIPNEPENQDLRLNGSVQYIRQSRIPTSTVIIDFETPSLMSEPRRVISPFTDSLTGVTFEVIGGRFGDGVIGLVKNSATSACADPRNSDQKLATGVSSSSLGLSNFSIKCIFPANLGGLITMSTEFQQLLGTNGRIRLYDAYDNKLAEQTEMTTIPMGTCGFPGNPRSRVRVTVISPTVASYAILDVLSNIVFVIDDVELEFAPIPNCGDVNGDSFVDYDDLTFLINFYFMFGDPPVLFQAADVNIDGVVDLGDIVFLAEYLNGTGSAPCSGSEPPPFIDWKKKPDGRGVGAE